LYRLRNHLPKEPARIWLSDEVERSVFRNGLQQNLLDGVVFRYVRRMIGRVSNCLVRIALHVLERSHLALAH
jgi:hypothetical protein